MPLREMVLKQRAADMLVMLPHDPEEVALVMAHLRWLVDNFWKNQPAASGSSFRSLAIVSDRSPVLPSSIHPIDRPGI